jgi:hypothetical protein
MGEMMVLHRTGDSKSFIIKSFPRILTSFD